MTNSLPLMVDTEEILNQFNQFVSDTLIQRVRQMLAEEEPLIDWSKVKIIPDFESNRFYFESHDPQVNSQLGLLDERLRTI